MVMMMMVTESPWLSLCQSLLIDCKCSSPSSLVTLLPAEADWGTRKGYLSFLLNILNLVRGGSQPWCCPGAPHSTEKHWHSSHWTLTQGGVQLNTPQVHREVLPLARQ